MDLVFRFIFRESYEGIAAQVLPLSARHEQSEEQGGRRKQQQR